MTGSAIDSETAARRRAMAAFAAATPAELAAAFDADTIAGARDLRPAEAGLVMVRGRIGGGGSAFNLGEATVARAS
ncbi:phosphonate C-P lyase system protein PhnG, partial [Prosthecomicrobium hirschii]